MSLAINTMFKRDPFKFIETYSVDIKGWFEGMVRSSGAVTNSRLYSASNEKGVCHIDFEPVDGIFGIGISTVQARFVVNGGMDAYWVPYHGGTELPGFTDVPRKDPEPKFVFTAGMNGCAFVVTDSPKGPDLMRVYHDQHPNNPQVMNKILAVGQPVISRATYDDYSGGILPVGMNPVAFNFLHYHDGHWHYVFQPQSFNALKQAPARRLDKKASTRRVF